MSGAALLAAAAMTMPMPMPPAGTATVDIPARSFAPSHLVVLLGETVTWHNSDVTAHAVTATDHGFASPRLAQGDEFSVTFDTPGDHTYFCPFHANMRGMVHVDALALNGPKRLLRPGDTAELSVLAPEGTGEVALERVAGSRARTLATSPVDAGGHASFTVPVDGPLRLRARAGELTSAIAPLRVGPRVTTTARRRGRSVTVRATVAPAIPGATVALERYVPLRFDYVPVRTTRAGADGRVAFTVRSPGRSVFRVAVRAAPGGWSPVAGRRTVVPPVR